MTIEERLKKKYGVTNNMHLAVWLLPNGDLINGSHDGIRRTVDHSEISEFFAPSKRQTPGSSYIYIEKFMRRGNIRIALSDLVLAFELHKTPTRAQLDILTPAILDCARKSIPVYAARMTQKGIKREDGPEFLEYVYKYLDYVY